MLWLTCSTRSSRPLAVTPHAGGDLNGLQLTVYRIVEEVLTNTLKHWSSCHQDRHGRRDGLPHGMCRCRGQRPHVPRASAFATADERGSSVCARAPRSTKGWSPPVPTPRAAGAYGPFCFRHRSRIRPWAHTRHDLRELDGTYACRWLRPAGEPSAGQCAHEAGRGEHRGEKIRFSASPSGTEPQQAAAMPSGRDVEILRSFLIAAGRRAARRRHYPSLSQRPGRDASDNCAATPDSGLCCPRVASSPAGTASRTRCSSAGASAWSRAGAPTRTRRWRRRRCRCIRRSPSMSVRCRSTPRNVGPVRNVCARSASVGGGRIRRCPRLRSGPGRLPGRPRECPSRRPRPCRT